MLGGVDAPVPGGEVRGHRGLVRASLLRPGGLQLRDGHGEVVAMRAVGQDLAVILDELAVVPGAVGILVEVDAGHGRGVGDVEGHRAGVALAAHRQVGDGGGLRVQHELVAHLVRVRGRTIRRSLDRHRVGAVGQLVAGLVVAIEEGFLTGELTRLRPAGLEVVEGLAHAVDRVGAH